MPIGYLVTVAFLACCTALAVAPRRPASSGPSNMSFRFGYLVNELPFLAFYWLLAATWLAAVQGDLDTPVGRVTLGLVIVTTGALAIVARRGLAAGPAIAQAMDDGLGADWRAAIAADAFGRLRRRRPPWGRILVWPVPILRRDVQRVADISYGDAGTWNLLDVYRHRSRPPDGPTLIYLHGGAFRGGRKNREARPLVYRLASQGWVCISANYRLSPPATFSDHLIDVKQVIAWVREHGAGYGADPNVVFLAGSSAGGHLAMAAALTPNDPTFQPGFERTDTSVTAAVSLYGYYGSLAGNDGPPSTPHAYLRPDAPPCFVAHGDQDTIVLVEDARAFVEELRRASSNAVVYAELPGGQHGFDVFYSIRFEAVVDAIEGFAAWVTSRTDASHRSQPHDR